MRVGLFMTCLVKSMRPSVAFATMTLLQGTPFDLIVPGNQSCCGQPACRADDLPSARTSALKFLQEFADCDYVVVPSLACTRMIKIEFPRLFVDQPMQHAMFEQIASRTYELTDFLVGVARIDAVPGEFVGEVAILESGADLSELNVHDALHQLLAMVKGLTLRPSNVRMPSDTDAVDLCLAATAGQVDAIVGADPDCLLALESRLALLGNSKTRVLHMAEVLAGVV